MTVHELPVYTARVFYTIPTRPATHTMSAPIDSPARLAEFCEALDATGWTYSPVEYHGDHDETGAPHDPAYDFHCYEENACPACGAQLEADATPSMTGSGWDHEEWCPNGCRLLRTPSGRLTASRLGAAW
jgi:hypothetical protein